MRPNKNETSFKAESILHESSLDGNFVVEISDAHLQQIKKSSYLQYSFSRSGLIQLVLADGTRLGFNKHDMSLDIAKTLVATCLNDKTVIGYDLYTSYILSHLITEEWRPSCTLNIPSLERVFRSSKPLVDDLPGIPQLLSMTSAKSFDEAMEQIFDWDERGDGCFFAACELIPHAMASIYSHVVYGMLRDGSDRLTFEGLLRNDFVRGKRSLMPPTRKEQLQFDLRFLPEVYNEYLLAAQSVSNAFTGAEEAKRKCA